MAPKVEFPILGGVYWGTPQTVNKAPGDIAGACRVAKICGRCQAERIVCACTR